MSEPDDPVATHTATLRRQRAPEGNFHSPDVQTVEFAVGICFEGEFIVLCSDLSMADNVFPGATFFGVGTMAGVCVDRAPRPPLWNLYTINMGSIQPIAEVTHGSD